MCVTDCVHTHAHAHTLCVHTVHRKFCEQTTFANISARQTLHCIENNVIQMVDCNEILVCNGRSASRFKQ